MWSQNTQDNIKIININGNIQQEMDNEGMHAFACKLRANCSRYSIYRQLERTWFPNENRSREISHEGQATKTHMKS